MILKSYNRGHHYEELLEFCKNQKITNTHNHHLPDKQHEGIGLKDLLDNSYTSWCGVPLADTEASRKDYIRLLGSNTYFYWLEKALQELCGISQRLDENTWDVFDSTIKKRFENNRYHLDVLNSLYEKVILDAYWNPGSNEGHPDIFAPTYRINMFLFGYSKAVCDHNGNNPFRICSWDDIPSFDDYIEAIEQQIIMKKSQGCVALKSAVAYDRGLDFHEVQKQDAQKAYMNPKATKQEIKDFQDYVFFEICRMAAKHHMPMQVHTGLGIMVKSNAMQLQEVITKNPKTQFILFHGSYPWLQDVLGLIHVYKNVYADLCWLPLISTTACEDFLQQLIEVGNMDKVMWGCDTWTSIESYGAVLAIRKVLSKVFSSYVDEGYVSLRLAKEYITHILSQNARKLYNL